MYKRQYIRRHTMWGVRFAFSSLKFKELLWYNSYLRASNFSTNLWSENLKLEALPTILSFPTKDWIEKLEARM